MEESRERTLGGNHGGGRGTSSAKGRGRGRGGGGGGKKRLRKRRKGGSRKRRRRKRWKRQRGTEEGNDVEGRIETGGREGEEEVGEGKSCDK